MLKSLFRDSVFYTLSSVLTRGISFLLLPVYTRSLMPSEYGLLDYFVALGAMMSMVVTLEVIQGLARYIPECLADEQKKRVYASTCMWFVLGSYTTMLVLIVLYSSQLSGFLFGTQEKAGLVELAGCSYWVGGVLNILHSQLRWELRAAKSALLSLLGALLTVACTIIMVVWLQWGIRGALLSQVVGGMLALLPGIYLTRSSFGLCFDWESLKRMLAYSMPLIPSSLAVVSSLYFDRIVLKELTGLSDVGVYAVGQRISLIVSVALIGFRGALTPLIYANYERESTPGDLARIFRIFCFSSLFLTLGISVFAHEIVGLMSSDAYSGAARVVPLLIFVVLLSNMYIFAPGLDIKRKTWLISIINIGAAVLSLALNFVLIPVLGILGASLSALIASGASFFCYMYASHKLYPVPHNWRVIAKLFIIVLMGIGVNIAMSYFSGAGGWIKILIMLFALTWMVRESGMFGTLAGMLPTSRRS